MAVVKKVVFFTALIMASIFHPCVGKTISKDASWGKQRDKRFAVDPLSVMGLVVSVASAIQGAVCTFTDVCGGDEVTQKLEALEVKLDAIENDVKSIKEDVEEIWDASKRKWYFKHIDYIISERKGVMRDLKNNDDSTIAKDRRDRFIDEVLGGAGNDEYVQKALFHIPNLVVKENFAKDFFDKRFDQTKSKETAAKKTWIFLKKLFRHQEDGYASVVLAASMRYKNDKKSYDKSMSQICSLWSKSRSSEYIDFCKQFVKDPELLDRRKIQMDYLYGWRDLHLYPGEEAQSECSQFGGTHGLHYSAGYLFVSQPAASRILLVNPENLAVLKTIDLPGSQCGGTCHPFGVSVNAENKVMAVAAQSKATGGQGTSYVFMYHIRGDLNNPSGLTIEFYYKMLQLFSANQRKADVRNVAFCGERFAYADYNGQVHNWWMDWSRSPSKPNLFDRYDWYLHRVINTRYGNIHYFGCSTSGSSWVIGSSGERAEHGAGAIPSDTSVSYTDNTLTDIADIKVMKSDWGDMGDSRSRMNIVKGVAMDSKKNLFYSAVQWWANGISGIYQRTHDAKRRFIREWNHQEPAQKTQIYDMAVDESGNLFVVQKEASRSTCIHKYHHEVDLEDINVK